MITVIFRTFIIYCAVAVCVRLMGKRQLGQLQPGELVITILISEIAASPITDLNVSVINTLIPLFMLVAFEIFASIINRHNLSFRYLCDGRPVAIIKNGKIDQKNLKRLRFTIDDILAGLRQKDIFDITEVEYAVVETNGTLSVLVKNEYQPLCREDISSSEKECKIPYPIIIDGRFLNNTEEILPIKKSVVEAYLRDNKIDKKDILLMTSDENKKFTIIRRDTE